MRRQSRFQSLLSWIGFKDTPVESSDDWVPLSFNPCCRGLGSKTVEIDDYANRVLAFQSLLSWIGFKDPAPPRVTDTPLMVSILVVVDWVQRQSMAGRTARHGLSFNPCCRGLGSKTRWRNCIQCWRQRVSILVVVDWVQRPRQTVQAQRDVTGVSILVVVDWVQRRQACRVHLVHLSGFQSLLSWIGFKDDTEQRFNEWIKTVSILVVVDWVQRQHEAIAKAMVNS